MLDEHLIVKTQPQARPENIVLRKGVRITVLEDRLFRIEVSGEDVFCDEATQTVWYRDFGKVPFAVEDGPEGLRIATRGAVLLWKGDIEKSSVILGGKETPLGNRGNLLGTYRTLDNCDGDDQYSFDGESSKAVPLALGTGVVSRTGVALLEDGDSLLLGEDGCLQAREHKERDVYVFAYGKDYRGAVRALFSICGSTPLIPRFALGNWWSRYHAYTEKEYLHTMDDFEERGIPLTVATVDMDWHWSVTLDERKQITKSGRNDALHGGSDGWTGYSWNTDLFPDYRRFLRRLHEKGLHVTLNLHPALGVRYFEDVYPQMAEAMGIDPATERRIPFDMTDDRFVNAYFKLLHKPYEHEGVDFWWIDWQQGTESGLEGLDPLWALNHYHFLDNGAERQPLILSRYCGIGSHRYPLGFSGDTIVTWKTLRYLPYFTATASNAGYCWWSHDIGGHMGGSKDDELYVRFVQFGVFSPVNRLHCSNSPTMTKEPWAYGNGAGLVAAEYLRLRHRMIPFLYSAAVDTAERGLALVEPLYYNWPEEEEAYRYPDEYLFGGQLLVAPVTEKSLEQGLARVKVWLPEGRWTDFFTDAEYEGGRELTMARWMEEMPVLIKEGGFFVLDDRKPTNDVELPDRLKVYAANGNGSYVLHEDLDGKRIRTEFASESAPGIQRVTIRRIGDGLPARRYAVRFCNIPEGEAEVRAEGRPYPALVDDNGRLEVVLEATEPDVEYEITVRFREEPERKRTDEIRRVVTRLQMENYAKDELLRKLCGCAGEEYRAVVEGTSLEGAAKDKLLEASA